MRNKAVLNNIEKKKIAELFLTEKVSEKWLYVCTFGSIFMLLQNMLENLYIGVALNDSTYLIKVLFSMWLVKAGVLVWSYWKLCE